LGLGFWRGRRSRRSGLRREDRGEVRLGGARLGEVSPPGGTFSLPDVLLFLGAFDAYKCLECLEFVETL
jgi:hypothetical protein